MKYLFNIIVFGCFICIQVCAQQSKSYLLFTPCESKIDSSYVAQDKTSYWSLSTNMLYDLALVPNIAAELYLGNRWSIKAGWAYNWINNAHTHAYWRLYGGGLEARKWFGKSSQVKPLQGHHVGLYVHAGTYDFEFGHTGNLSYFSYAAGVSYGYCFPITSRINIDFEIGMGYFGGEYKEYIPIDQCYVWQADKQRHYIGPTKAEVSLIWLLGRGNVNKDKEGRKR